MDTGDAHAYGFPLAPGRVGLKLALHEPGEPVDPDAVPRDLRPAERERLLGVLAAHIPDGLGPVLSHATCIYTNSPDGHFVIDRCPGSARTFFAAGFSGHGFKFAPIIGEALADLALNGRTDLPIGFLGLARLAGERAQ
jgi:sarcosine oxidase